MAVIRGLAPLALSAAVALGIAACGGAGTRTPQASGLPLASGAHVVAQQRTCNAGASSFCGIEMVVSGAGYRSSHQLVLAERDLLRSNGWVGASPDTGDEVANESPQNKLRVTYGTAFDELKAVDLGWFQRSWPIVSALDGSLFNDSPAISVLLEIGSQ